MANDPEYVDVTTLRSMFSPPPARATIDAWVAKGRLSPFKIGGKNYFKISDVKAAIEGAGRQKAEPKVVVEPMVRQIDTAPEALAVARRVIANGRLPDKLRTDWRNLFSWAVKAPLPADVRSAFGLNEYADFVDLADAIEWRINPRKPDPRNVMHGWEPGTFPTTGVELEQARAGREK